MKIYPYSHTLLAQLNELADNFISAVQTAIQNDDTIDTYNTNFSRGSFAALDDDMETGGTATDIVNDDFLVARVFIGRHKL